MDIIQNNIARLRNLDSCAVSDALDRLNLSGVVSGVPHRSGMGLVAGTIITVKLDINREEDTNTSFAQHHLGTTAIEKGGTEHVIVIEQKTGIEAGSWGGLLTLGAIARGINGVISDGPVRDIDVAIEYKFSVFSTSLTARTARGRIIEKGTNIPIEVWGQKVIPGDYVIADHSSIIFINNKNIKKVLDEAEIISSREKHMAQSILSGTSISKVLDENYETMLKR